MPIKRKYKVKNKPKSRISLTIDKELLNKLDFFSKTLAVGNQIENRSALIEDLVRRYVPSIQNLGSKP